MQSAIALSMASLWWNPSAVRRCQKFRIKTTENGNIVLDVLNGNCMTKGRTCELTHMSGRSIYPLHVYTHSQMERMSCMNKKRITEKRGSEHFPSSYPQFTSPQSSAPSTAPFPVRLLDVSGIGAVDCGEVKHSGMEGRIPWLSQVLLLGLKRVCPLFYIRTGQTHKQLHHAWFGPGSNCKDPVL